MPVEMENFSLRALRSKLREARDAEVDGVTIDVTFNSPTDFKHSWTLEDIEEPEELDEEIEETINAAKNRLKNGWESGTQSEDGDEDKERFQKVWNEIQSGMDLDLPDELEEFVDLKESEDQLEEAVGLTREVYDQVDTPRVMSIQQRVNSSSETIEEYTNNMHRVNQNIEFEENVDSAWQDGRQRTTGELEWHTRDGTKMGTLIYPNKVIFQFGGRGGSHQKEFQNKEAAREWYREKRLG